MNDDPLVTALAVNDTTDTALGVIAVSCPSGDEMNVGVKNGLTG